jgi:multiple sugar transport system substrate-binding protein
MTSAHRFRGLTWDHPRGYDALAAAAAMARRDGLQIQWDKQPLEGFESAAIDRLAQEYDLLVIDHPHLGDALAQGCLQDVGKLFGPSRLAAWRTQSVGQSFSSYRYGEGQWALPLDAATQVAAWRPDLSTDPAPSTWAHLPTYAQRHPICLSLAGPHAFLTLCSMAHAFGARMGDFQEPLFSGGDMTAAWNLLSSLHAHSPAAWRDKNPIALRHGMSTTDQIAYCPLVYGYVNYAGPHSPGKQISFVDAPGGPDGAIGSVLGGTGIAITQGCPVTPALLRHLEHLMAPDTQASFIPAHNGQPSARAAWEDKTLDAEYNGFYANTQRTLENAFVRPRFPGYTRFQLEASESVRALLAARANASAALPRLENLHRIATSKGI